MLAWWGKPVDFEAEPWRLGLAGSSAKSTRRFLRECRPILPTCVEACEIREAARWLGANFARLGLLAGRRARQGSRYRLQTYSGVAYGPRMLRENRPAPWSGAAGVAVSRRRLHCASGGCARATGGCHQIRAGLSRKARQGTLSATAGQLAAECPAFSPETASGRVLRPLAGGSIRGEIGAPSGVYGQSGLRLSRRLRGRASAGLARARPAPRLPRTGSGSACRLASRPGWGRWERPCRFSLRGR